MNSLFEETRRSIETVLVRDDRMSAESFQERAMADMAAALRIHAEVLSRQMASLDHYPVAELPRVSPGHQLSPPAPAQGTPAPNRTAAASASAIDDAQLENALREMGEGEGWWHDDPDAILAQFDMMLTGLFALQEEYLGYCRRKVSIPPPLSLRLLPSMVRSRR